MSMNRNAALALLGVMSLVAATAGAQNFPERAIRLVVPFPPGGSSDLLGRTVAQKMSESIGRPVVVDNRGGAAGVVGSEMVARAAPDGYTIVLGTAASHVSVIFLSKVLPYDAVRDFTPISAAAESPLVLAVHPSFPAANMREFVEYAKKNPGKLSFGTSGNGSPHHLAGELLKQVAGIDMTHVPYKGTAGAMQDVMGGQLPVAVITLAPVLPQVRAGKLKALGVVEAARQPSAPDIPAIGEQVPGYAMPRTWLGFFGPGRMPEPIVARLNAEIVKALNAPDTRAKLDAAGLPVMATSAAEFAAIIRENIEVFRKIITTAAIPAE